MKVHSVESCPLRVCWLVENKGIKHFLEIRVKQLYTDDFHSIYFYCTVSNKSVGEQLLAFSC
jgi:hypothetical protein